MTTHRRQMICAHPDCNVTIRADSVSGVCNDHSHQGHCTCKKCGGKPAVKAYSTSVTLPPMPWEVGA